MNPVESGLVFIVIAIVGWLSGHFHIITKEGRAHMTKILFYLLLPALVGSGVMKSPLTSDTMYIFFLTIIGTLIVWYLLLRIFMIWHDKKTASLFALVTTIGNTGFLGFPLVSRMIGENAMPYAIAFSIGQAVILVSVIYPSLGGNFSFKKLLSPPLVGMTIGFMLKMINPVIPGSIWNVTVDAFSMLGSASGPLVMLIIGSSLEKIDIRAYDVALVGIKIFVMPILFYIILFKFITPIPLKTVILEAATPTLMAAPIWASMAGLSEVEASRIVAVSTGAFLILLPFIGMIL